MIKKIAIIGSGNIGISLAKGLVKAAYSTADQITLTRRNLDHLKPFATAGFNISNDNKAVVADSEIVILAVLPQQLNVVLDEISSTIDPTKHLVISVISGVSCAAVKEKLGNDVQSGQCQIQQSPLVNL
jgi:pyrroline-5-carboxylate reductase